MADIVINGGYKASIPPYLHVLSIGWFFSLYFKKEEGQFFCFSEFFGSKSDAWKWFFYTSTPQKGESKSST